jgi:hypothetical protein
VKEVERFKSEEDRYGGFTVTIHSASDIVCDPHSLEKLHQLLWTKRDDEKVKTLWVSVPVPFTWRDISLILPDYFHVGELDDKLSGVVVDYHKSPFQHKFWYWKGLPKDCSIPPGANMNIGATALLLDRKHNKVCLVSPSIRASFYNFPGGNLDWDDKWSFVRAAKREGWEEVGFTEEEFDKHVQDSFITGIMSFPKNQLAGAMNITVCFYVDGLSEIPTKLDKREINTGGWKDVGEVLACDGVKDAKIDEKLAGSSITASLKAALSGKGLKEVEKGKVWAFQE